MEWEINFEHCSHDDKHSKQWFETSMCTFSSPYFLHVRCFCLLVKELRRSILQKGNPIPIPKELSVIVETACDGNHCGEKLRNGYSMVPDATGIGQSIVPGRRRKPKNNLFSVHQYNGWLRNPAPVDSYMAGFSSIHWWHFFLLIF